jgi:hypothetical protein
MASTQQNPRPVLMIPLRRCGSHALRLRLNANPEFYAPYPLHIVDFMPLLHLYGDLNDDNKYFQLITDVIGLQTGLMVKWPDISLDPVEIFDAIKNERRSIHRIVWEMLFTVARKQNASVVMDKSLDSISYADELLELFPDMQFLNVVRDPRAQVASMNKAIIHDFHSLLNARTWVHAYDQAKALATQHPEKVLTIRYEDFISNQAEVIQQICDFFGIRFSENMLDISHSNEAKSIAKRSALWESNNSAPIKANVEKFRKSLTDEEIEIIETQAAEHMKYYGYEFITTAAADVGEYALKKAQQQSELNREKAWQALKENDPQDYMLRRFRVDYLNMLKSRLMQENASFPEPIRNQL